MFGLIGTTRLTVPMVEKHFQESVLEPQTIAQALVVARKSMLQDGQGQMQLPEQMWLLEQM